LFATLFTRCSLQLFANFGSLTKFLRRFGHQHWNRTRSRNRPHAPRHFGSSKPLNFHAENEFTVCYQTLTLRNCLLSRRNASRESFRALFVGPRPAHFSDRRKYLISSCRIGY